MEFAADKAAIGELINGFMYRDTAQWQKLSGLFSADAVIEVTWFEGLARDFIAASQKMSASPLTTKHLIGTPVISCRPQRAVAETNVMIIVLNADLRLGSTVHARFYDYVEKHDNAWKISRRQVIYDFGSFDFPAGPVAIDAEVAARFPLAYAALGYLLNSAGYPVKRLFATKGSEQETAMRQAGERWLEG